MLFSLKLLFMLFFMPNTQANGYSQWLSIASFYPEFQNLTLFLNSDCILSPKRHWMNRGDDSVGKAFTMPRIQNWIWILRAPWLGECQTWPCMSVITPLVGWDGSWRQDNPWGLTGLLWVMRKFQHPQLPSYLPMMYHSMLARSFMYLHSYTWTYMYMHATHKEFILMLMS